MKPVECPKCKGTNVTKSGGSHGVGTGTKIPAANKIGYQCNSAGCNHYFWITNSETSK